MKFFPVWDNKLVTFIQQCNGIRDRSKVVELWSGVAQYCLLVGNYNSATVILESLESPAIARLQTTVCTVFIFFQRTFFLIRPFVVSQQIIYINMLFPVGCLSLLYQFVGINIYSLDERVVYTMHKIIEFCSYYISTNNFFLIVILVW